MIYLHSGSEDAARAESWAEARIASRRMGGPVPRNFIKIPRWREHFIPVDIK